MANDNVNKIYLNKETLPAPSAEFEFTPAMAREYKKCMGDITHFAENYFFITNLDVGKTKIGLYPAQKRVLKSTTKNRFVIVMASRQAGKCFCGDTKITIRNKKTGNIEEISIKDFYEMVESRQTGSDFPQ